MAQNSDEKINKFDYTKYTKSYMSKTHHKQKTIENWEKIFQTNNSKK